MVKKTWEIIGKDIFDESETTDDKIIDILLENRKLKNASDKKDFLTPKSPRSISLKELHINEGQLKKAIKRINLAIKNKEEIIIFGDYDADGISATAILWLTLYPLSKIVLPFIPDRFIDGYGITVESIDKLLISNPKTKVIICVDNGIIAKKAIDYANKKGISVVILDHHQKEDTLPKAHSIVHTTEICGSALAWIFIRDYAKKYPLDISLSKVDSLLDLCTIGTIADQMPLIGVNRSIVKYGLEVLKKTQRKGLLSLISVAGIEKENIGTYEVGYLIAPRINAMGRLAQGLDSLRLLCTTDSKKAYDLSLQINKTNIQRQEIVDKVVAHALKNAKNIGDQIIVLDSPNYHEGVIGLAAAKLVESFYLPAIVISKGKKISKGSARSVSGFNIINAIKKADKLLIGGGGHSMAAGFSLETKNIVKFKKEMKIISEKLLTKEILQKKLKVDMRIELSLITKRLLEKLKIFDPTGIGNPTPNFMTENIEVVSAKKVGKNFKHLKLTLKKEKAVFGAIGFNFGGEVEINQGDKIDLVYTIEENVWNGNSDIQLKIRDIRVCN